ncbi:MAG: PspC domain-containing protein [Pseudomonadales bacterium]|nr:PspC domain-containing protein [Pseudomonadales bacterium]
MSEDRTNRQDAGGYDNRSARNGDFQAALGRLERVVQQLVGSARSEFTDRATSLLDETTTRLEQELGRRARPGSSAAGRLAGAAGGEPGRPRNELRPVSRRLCRDPERQKIGGVCAGIARYYGLEPWVVRCIAVTALLFYPGIVFPAYWIAYFVMETPAGAGRRGTWRRHGHRRRDGDHVSGTPDDVAPAPELGPRLSPRRGLRNVQADLTEVELRLRRMEAHVTSGRYELQRELGKIDPVTRA